MYKQDRGGLHMARYGIYCLSLWICLSAPMKASSHLFRLFGGSSPCQGTVQIRSQDAWLPVCNGSWSNNLTAVLCRDLRCGKPEAQTGSLQTQPVNQTFLTLTCSDNDSLKNCKISPMESDCPEPVSVYCTGSYDLRLSDGVSRCSGRVEVFLDGVWGSVCDDGWDALDAHVTCQQLGCGSALQALGASYFGPGPSTIHWEDVKCNGTERHLWDCPSSTRHDCTDREHAGVICTEDKAFRVSGGPHNCSGRIEVLMDGAWGTVCDSQWFEEDFQMFCKLLGCGPYVRKTIYNHSLSTYMGIICTNTASLLDCRVYHKNNNICQQAGALGVICGSFYNTEKEAGQAVSPVNPGFPLLAMMICVTLAALLLVAVITFSLVIWRMKRLQRVSLQITSLTPTNGYREATLRPPKTPVPASIPVVPVVIEPQSDSDDCEFNGGAPPAPFMTFQDSSRKEPEQNRHQEEHQQEKPARKESYRASKSTSSTSSEEDNWYENYKGRHQELLEVLHSHSSFTSSAEYDDVVSEHSI